MKTVRILACICLVAIVVMSLHISGVVDSFNNMINKQNGWVKSDSGYGYIKHQLKIETTYFFTVLKDPKADKSFQVFQGTMKKAAVDRMTYITEDKITAQIDESRERINDRLKIICHYKGGNTVIIDSKIETITTETKGWSIGSTM